MKTAKLPIVDIVNYRQCGFKSATGRIMVLTLVLLFAGLGYAVADTNQPSNPVYSNVAITYWFDKLPSPAIEFPQTNEAVVAIRSMGTNALPFLLNALTTGETNITAWKASDGFYCLGEVARPAIPELTKMLHNPNLTKPVSESLSYLFCRDGFQALASGLSDSNAYVRWSSAEGLGFPGPLYGRATNDQSVLQFRREASVAIPALIAALKNQDSDRVHVAIIIALGDIRESPEIVVPVLKIVATDVARSDSEHKAARKTLAAFDVQ